MGQTRLVVVGSAAGGGFPQWNCNCANCAAVRAGDDRFIARTQSSVAWSRDGRHWLLLNASPDILTQLRQCACLHPKSGVRDTGIAAVMLMDAQIDHVTGLVMLRENAHPLPIYASKEVLQDLSDGFPLTKLLSHYCTLQTHSIQIDPSTKSSPALRWPWLEGGCIEVHPISSKPPPYSPWRNAPRVGDNLSVMLINEQTGKKLFYAPGLGNIDDHVLDCLQQADIVLVDGTFWTDDEMIAQGLGKKSAKQMGHLPLSGHGGLIDVLQKLPTSTRKILIHINNSNPILRSDSPEREILNQAGIEVAWDNMEIDF